MRYLLRTYSISNASLPNFGTISERTLVGGQAYASWSAS